MNSGAVAEPAVAIVGPVPPPLGGMALQAEVLHDKLASEGIRVVLVSTNPGLPRLLNRIPGLRAVLKTIIYLCRLVRSVPRVSVVHVLAASYFYFFARVVPAVLISRAIGRRVIVNYRGGLLVAFFSSCGWLIRPILRLANLITVPSAYLARCFHEQGFTSVIIGNPINLDQFKFRARDHLEAKLLVTRNLEPMYNVEMALRAFQTVKQSHEEARLDVVGTGSEEPRLKQWVQQNGLRDVFFHGAVPHDAIPEYLDRADILLNPTNVDNFPMNLLEAFAAGLPVVSTNVGGIPDLVGGQSAALLVEPNNDREMSEKILFILANPNGAQSLIACARRLAEGFSWDRVREKLMATYFPQTHSVTMTNAIDGRKA